jgi:hypothetical protein
MQGLPSEEGYQPLPPNSLEDNYRGEVENRSTTGSVATPLIENLERTLVTIENPNPHTQPMSATPLQPLLV